VAETVTEQLDQAENSPDYIHKRPVGRPRKDGQPAGSAPPDAPTKKEAENLDREDFFLRLMGMTSDDWNQHVLYIYRLYPITDRRSSGKPIWIDKFSEAIDQGRIKGMYGSGVYRVELIQVKAGESGKRIATSTFQILDTDYPPKVPAGDWVNDTRNADWEWCRPKLGPQISGQGSTASDIADAVTRVIKETRPESNEKEQATMVTAFMEMAKSNQLLMSQLMDPGRQLQVMTAMLALLPKAPERPAVDPLVTMLMDDRKAMREELSELRKMLAEKPSPKSWIETAMENEEMMRRMFGKGQSGPQLDGWAAVIDKAVDKIGPAVATVGTLFAQRAMMPQPPAQQNGRPPLQTQPAALPAPVVQPAQPPEPQQAPALDAQQQLMNKYGPIIQQAFPFLIDHFKDRDGYEFRDWFLSPMRFGNVAWDGMRREIGIDGFVHLLASMPPEIQQQLAPPEKFKQFMAEFFSDDDPPEGGGPDEEEFSKPPE
jgi:hypothetical protein